MDRIGHAAVANKWESFSGNAIILCDIKCSSLEFQLPNILFRKYSNEFSQAFEFGQRPAYSRLHRHARDDVFRAEHALVGGHLYGQIVLGKDPLADILPPPEYIIEPYLEATLALDDPSAVAQHRERLAALRKDYDARHQYWIPQEFDDNLRALLVEGAHKPATRFWEAYREAHSCPPFFFFEKGDGRRRATLMRKCAGPTATIAPRSTKS